MIHISSSKASPSLTSTMCSRRHRGMLQTSIILVLLCCIGYGFYLYNLLQARMKYLDSKALHHQSKHQSLSSQLQVVYEDRARLEKAVQNSKSELQKAKEEFDKHRQEKEDLVQQMLIEHQDKYQSLEEESRALKESLTVQEKETRDLQQKQILANGEHEKLKFQYKELLNNHAGSLKELRESNDVYRRENDQIRRNQEDLQDQLQQAKDSETKYANLRNVLKALPAGVVNVNHPAVHELESDRKQILLDHLSEDAAFQQDPIREGRGRHEDDEAQRRRDYENVQRQLNPDAGVDVKRPGGGGYQRGAEQDNQYRRIGDDQADDVDAGQQQPEMKEVDVCALPSDHGPCGESHVRFYYNTNSKDCMAFNFGGCGGNENNFKTWEECTSFCNDPERRVIQKPVSEEEQGGDMYDRENDGQDTDERDDDRQQEEDDDQEELDSRQNIDPKNIQQVYPDKSEDEEEDDALDENEKIADEEERRRQQEELARKELLDAQNPDNNDEPVNEDDDPLAKLQKISEEQMKVAKDQEDSMRKLIEQQNVRARVTGNDQLEARITDEEDADANDPNNEEDEDPYANEEEDEGEEEDAGEEEEGDENDVRKEDNVQVAVPPNAKVAGQDPEAVMNRPPAADPRDEEQRDPEEDENNEDPGDENDDPLYEKGGERDPGEDYDENQPEEDENPGDEEDFNQDGDTYNDRRGDDFDQGVHHANFMEGDKEEDGDNGEEDPGYEDEDDPEEEDARDDRDRIRMRNDKHFAAMQQMEQVLPQQGGHFERENRDI